VIKEAEDRCSVYRHSLAETGEKFEDLIMVIGEPKQGLQ
jgi:hypothetical protein